MGSKSRYFRNLFNSRLPLLVCYSHNLFATLNCKNPIKYATYKKEVFWARLKENIAWHVIKNLYLTWTAADVQEQTENKGDFLQHLQFIMLLYSSYERKPSFSSFTQGKPRFRTNHEPPRVLLQLPSMSFSFALLKKLIHVYVAFIKQLIWAFIQS